MTRHALRSLRRSPAYSITAILTLGLSIGLTTAAFSLLNGFVLRPLPFIAAPDSLVDVGETSHTALCAGCGVGTSFPIFQEWRGAARSFAGLEAITERPFSVSGGERAAARVGGALVSAGLFPLLGVAPQVGRGFTPQDDRVGAAPVAIVSHEIWQDRLRGASLSGLSIRLNGIDRTVIGVMPAGFGFPEFARLWVPLAPEAAGWTAGDRSLMVIGRLAPAVTLAQASAEMSSIGEGIAARYPATHREWTVAVGLLRESFVGDEARLFWLLVGMVLVVLLIACVNLAGVGLARAASRQREFAVRVAIGADAGTLIRLLLTETLWLSAAGGALALLLAPWGVDLARALLPPQIPAWLRFDVDWRVAMFCAAVTMTAGLAAGLLPAWRASRPEVMPALKSGAGASADGQRLRLWLVGAELTLALMLLVSAGLLTKTFARATSADPGYDISGLLGADLALLGSAYDEPPAIAAFAGALEEQLARLPGARASAVSHTRFIAGFGGTERAIEAEGVAVPAGGSPRFAYLVTPGYFETLGIAVRAGRGFTRSDGPGREPVVIVNEALAARLWPGQPALDKRLRLPDEPWRTVVGVVANVAGSPLGARRDPPSYVYLPFDQSPARPLTLHVRSATTAYAVAPELIAAVGALDRDEPVENVKSAEDMLADWILPARLAAILADTVSALAVVLAAIGLYGVVAYTVGRREREFGIRMAVGATAGDVLRLVLGQGLRVTIAALVAGTAAAAGTTHLLRMVLFGGDPLDPAVFATSAAVLLLVMSAATILPARRAARIEPHVALRQD